MGALLHWPARACDLGSLCSLCNHGRVVGTDLSPLHGLSHPLRPPVSAPPATLIFTFPSLCRLASATLPSVSLLLPSTCISLLPSTPHAFSSTSTLKPYLSPSTVSICPFIITSPFKHYTVTNVSLPPSDLYQLPHTYLHPPTFPVSASPPLICLSPITIAFPAIISKLPASLPHPSLNSPCNSHSITEPPPPQPPAFPPSTSTIYSLFPCNLFHIQVLCSSPSTLKHSYALLLLHRPYSTS